MIKSSDILAYTCSHGDRTFLADTVKAMRGAAGCWFDWAVFLSAPSPELVATAEACLNDPKRQGIQYLRTWSENRGQHYATKEALEIAREHGYKWLLRLDDDVQPRTKKFLMKMVDRLEDLKKITEDEFYRFIAAPRVLKLRNPLHPIGMLDKGQKFNVEVMPVLGGVCRLHPMDLLGHKTDEPSDCYEPDLYDPVGRGDPESITEHLENLTLGFQVRFPDIRVVHWTDDLEKRDSPEDAKQRRMAKYWPWLGAEDAVYQAGIEGTDPAGEDRGA